MRSHALVLSLMVLVGCSINARKKKLTAPELKHYRALEVYLDQPDRKGQRPKAERLEYLKLKTVAERDKWMKAKILPSSQGEGSLWDRFYKYEPHIREKISEGDVQVGWSLDMLYMAWGRPMKREKPPACDHSRCWRYIYRFEDIQGKDGAVYTQVWVPGSRDEYRAVSIYDREVEVGDNKVLKITRKERPEGT